MKIGVLAVQGAFIEHEAMLNRIGVDCVEIRRKEHLKGINGIILPGGESTVQGLLLRKLDILEPLTEIINDGLPVLATCAGLILLSEKISNDTERHIGTLPIVVKRNAYGRQLSSFEISSDVGEIKDFPMVFIRAPYIESVSQDVGILSRVDGKIVAVQYKNQIGLSFHPELTLNPSVHEYFVNGIQTALCCAV